MRVYTNGGSQDYTEFGTLKFFPFDVFYNPTSMANILALKDVANKFKITMDTTKERADFIILTLPPSVTKIATTLPSTPFCQP